MGCSKGGVNGRKVKTKKRMLLIVPASGRGGLRIRGTQRNVAGKKRERENHNHGERTWQGKSGRQSRWAQGGEEEARIRANKRAKARKRTNMQSERGQRDAQRGVLKLKRRGGKNEPACD